MYIQSIQTNSHTHIIPLLNIIIQDMEEYQVPEFILSNQEEEAEAVPHEAEPMEERQTNPLEQLHAALNLAKAMPPSKLRKNLIGLTTLAPNIEDALQ